LVFAVFAKKKKIKDIKSTSCRKTPAIYLIKRPKLSEPGGSVSESADCSWRAECRCDWHE
jgi:hypothetical protein